MKAVITLHIICIICLYSCKLVAQDYIIIENNDTIFCKIINEDEEKLKYLLLNSVDPSIKILHYSEIIDYTSTHSNKELYYKYVEGSLRNSKIDQIRSTKRVVRTPFTIGYTHWYYNKPSFPMNEYGVRFFNELKNGFNINLDITFMLSKKSGLGFTLSNFHSTASVPGIMESVNISLIGVLFTGNIDITKRSEVSIGFGIGNLKVKDQIGGKIGIGNDIGIKMMLYYEYMFDKNFGFITGINTILGEINSVLVKETKYSYETNMVHTNYSVGVVVYITNKQ